MKISFAERYIEILLQQLYNKKNNMMEYTALSHWKKATLLLFGFLLCHLASTAFAQDSNQITAEMRMEKGADAAKNEIRNFVLYNYAHLADDIINGRGIYLEAVYTLLEIKKEERNICQKHFCRILLEENRIPDFSRCISEYSVPRAGYLKPGCIH